MLEGAFARRIEDVPEAWKTIVSAMQAEVHAKVEQQCNEDGRSVEERRGYYWSFRVGFVGDMLEHVMRQIRADLGLKEGEATLASMLLVKNAITRLNIELQDSGSADGREDGEENRYRVLQALRALAPRFDDVNLRRFRAMQVAESAVKWTLIPPTDEEIARLQQELEMDDLESERHREFVKIDQPVLSGVTTRDSLTKIDPRFGTLDPLVVFEEFSEAEPVAGGRVDGGEGRIGPVRALARLAVMSGALDYSQEPGEDFDTAVSRARSNLLVTRSRIRKTLRLFPGETPDNASGEG